MELALSILFWLIFTVGALACIASIALIAWVRAHLHRPSDDPYSDPWGDA